ncbi:DUF1622 domain-containing protein [Ensifer sp. IC4062]|nr:DUF1622 domain-containing protein [Ensifer sp. IC4062]
MTSAPPREGMASLIAPVLEPMAVMLEFLGLVVIIRTLLSFSLEAEIDGEWPWRRRWREAHQTRVRPHKFQKPLANILL